MENYKAYGAASGAGRGALHEQARRWASALAAWRAHRDPHLLGYTHQSTVTPRSRKKSLATLISCVSKTTYEEQVVVRLGHVIKVVEAPADLEEKKGAGAHQDPPRDLHK